jgi:hypothetical protein
MLVLRGGVDVPKLIATGSPRRRLQVKLMFPAVEFTEIRGNVDTRLRKIGELHVADGTILAAAGLKLELTLPTDAPRWAPTIEITCFRVAQEAMTNIMRHANARHVWVDLQFSPVDVRLRVQDDGHVDVLTWLSRPAAHFQGPDRIAVFGCGVFGTQQKARQEFPSRRPPNHRHGIKPDGVTAGLHPVGNCQVSVAQVGARSTVSPQELIVAGYNIQARHKPPHLHPVGNGYGMIAVGPRRHIRLVSHRRQSHRPSRVCGRKDVRKGVHQLTTRRHVGELQLQPHGRPQPRGELRARRRQRDV